MTLAVLWSQPLWFASTAYLGRAEPQGYRHETHAVGGYWAASFSLHGDEIDWLVNGLGRHVEVVGPDLQTAWEGFVNTVTVPLGAMEVTRGPMLDVGNKIKLIYATLNTVVYPPIVGDTTETAVAEDSDSQARWGVRYRILSTGGVTDDDAEQMRDLWLAENAEPRSERNAGGGAKGDVQLECLGYWHLLDYPYNEEATGAQNVSDKIAAVIADDPNSLFTATVASNTLQVEEAEDTSRLARDVLEDLVARGDASDDRWLIGCWKDRELVYEEAPTDAEYAQFVDAWDVLNTAGSIVPPWLVKPGKWLRWLGVPSYEASDLRQDLKMEFIEYVVYDDARERVEHNGVRDSKLARLLARKGLARV